MGVPLSQINLQGSPDLESLNVDHDISGGLSGSASLSTQNTQNDPHDPLFAKEWYLVS